MILTVYDIVSANSILTKILNHPFTAKQSFIISRTLRSLLIEVENFEKVREEVIKNYAEKDDNGNIIITNGQVKIRDNRLDIFQKEIEELLHTEINIDIKPIPLEWLNDIIITPQEMLILEPFLEIDK